MAKMVENPHAYFRQWVPGGTELQQALEGEAQKEGIPIVGPVVGNLLYLLAMLKGARRIIELGTATGYSALFLGKACLGNDGRLTTFEVDPAMAARATGNIEKAGLAQCVDVQCQDALQALSAMAEPADMIFMDIDKKYYEGALPLCRNHLHRNGLLVADNTGFEDARGFNKAIFESPDWESVNLWTFLPGHSPETDGLCIALKRS